MKLLKLFFISLLLCSTLSMQAQSYAPAAGQSNSTAMRRDSSAFKSWATTCSVIRGLQDVSTPSLGTASAGEPSLACGASDINGIVSLGDGGSATCTFQYPIINGPGFDFAVFENSFDDVFLELAFVEVSSDGVHYYRFPSHSLSDTVQQTGTFGSTDAAHLNNLAGKYRGGYGTPFDLQDLAGIQGLNVNAITHVKITDVIGSLSKSFLQRDAFGNPINDPWPTPFPSGGFDLDAIGVINQQGSATSLNETFSNEELRVYPTCLKRGENIQIQCSGAGSLWLMDMSGKSMALSTDAVISTHDWLPGVYLFMQVTGTAVLTKRIIIL